MIEQIDTSTSVQPLAHLFMQEAIWLGANIPLERSFEYIDFYVRTRYIKSTIRILEELNQMQLPARAQSIVESEANLRGWHMCGRAQVDEALYHLEEWPQHQHSTLEWIELYVKEWYDTTALLLGEWCPATATSFYAGVTDAMTELL